MARDEEVHLRVCGRIPCLLALRDISHPRTASASACPKITLGYKTIVTAVDRLSKVLCSVPKLPSTKDLADVVLYDVV